jgi:hypothetical protein
VTFTDYLPGVLANLRASVAINEANAPMNDPDQSSPCAFSVRHLEWLSAVPGLVEKTKRVGAVNADPSGVSLPAHLSARPTLSIPTHLDAFQLRF